jgi:hypothetical protein
VHGHVPRREQDTEPSAAQLRRRALSGGDAKPAGVTGRPFDARTVLALQRAVGNTAVVRLLREAGAIQRSATTDVLRSTGRPLDPGTRDEMESRLGADFGDVRVHDGAAAADSAKRLGARAYTSGSHIVLGAGGEDRHTLAHELTHVIQQRRGPVSGTDNGSGLRVSDPSDRFEREAEANATRALSGPTPAPRGGAGRGPERTGVRPPESCAEPSVQRVLAFEAEDAWTASAVGELGIFDQAVPDGSAVEWTELAKLYGVDPEKLDEVRNQLKEMLETIRRSNRTVTVRIDSALGARGTFRARNDSPPSGEVILKERPAARNPVDTRHFIVALAHELQHAVDFANKDFGLGGATNDEDRKREAYKTIGSELRAWGREAFIAHQLGPGSDNERKDLIKVYQGIRDAPDRKVTFVDEISRRNIFLHRLLTYLKREFPGAGVTDADDARAWLVKTLSTDEKDGDANTGAVVRGLLDGARYFPVSASSSSSSSSSS